MFRDETMATHQVAYRPYDEVRQNVLSVHVCKLGINTCLLSRNHHDTVKERDKLLSFANDARGQRLAV
jgi:hypothetical protein